MTISTFKDIVDTLKKMDARIARVERMVEGIASISRRKAKQAGTATVRSSKPVEIKTEYISPSELARILNVSPSTISARINSGAIKSITIPSVGGNRSKPLLRRISRVEVERILGFSDDR